MREREKKGVVEEEGRELLFRLYAKLKASQFMYLTYFFV